MNPTSHTNFQQERRLAFLVDGCILLAYKKEYLTDYFLDKVLQVRNFISNPAIRLFFMSYG